MGEIKHNPKAMWADECDCLDCQIKVRKMDLNPLLPKYKGKEGYEGEGWNDMSDMDMEKLRNRKPNL